MTVRVALVHDWTIHMRGGEKVLEALAGIFPQAVIFTLFSDRSRLSRELAARDIRTSFLQRVPGIRRFYRWLLPIFPWVISRFNLRGFNLVISSSHCVAKGVRVPPGARHICYCHAPMRYAWGFEEDYFGSWPRPARAIVSRCLGALRRWDLASNRRVDLFLCNSENVRERIARFYGREAQVIYPPCDTAPVEGRERESPLLSHDSKTRGLTPFFLVVSHLVPYKRIDLAVDAFTQLGWPLRVVGSGPLAARLKARAGGSVEFLGWVDDERLRDLYAKARALVFPGEEDFGMVPVEAQAQGCPVVAYGRGGALESVEPYDPGTGRGSGVHFFEQTPNALAGAVREAASISWDRESIRRRVRRFSREAFRQAFLAAAGLEPPRLAVVRQQRGPLEAGVPHAT